MIGQMTLQQHIAGCKDCQVGEDYIKARSWLSRVSAAIQEEQEECFAAAQAAENERIQDA